MIWILAEVEFKYGEIYDILGASIIWILAEVEFKENAQLWGPLCAGNLNLSRSGI